MQGLTKIFTELFQCCILAEDQFCFGFCPTGCQGLNSQARFVDFGYGSETRQTLTWSGWLGALKWPWRTHSQAGFV